MLDPIPAPLAGQRRPRPAHIIGKFCDHREDENRLVLPVFWAVLTAMSAVGIKAAGARRLAARKDLLFPK